MVPFASGSNGTTLTVNLVIRVVYLSEKKIFTNDQQHSQSVKVALKLRLFLPELAQNASSYCQQTLYPC